MSCLKGCWRTRKRRIKRKARLPRPYSKMTASATSSLALTSRLIRTPLNTSRFFLDAWNRCINECIIATFLLLWVRLLVFCVRVTSVMIMKTYQGLLCGWIVDIGGASPADEMIGLVVVGYLTLLWPKFWRWKFVSIEMFNWWTCLMESFVNL